MRELGDLTQLFDGMATTYWHVEDQGHGHRTTNRVSALPLSWIGQAHHVNYRFLCPVSRCFPPHRALPTGARRTRTRATSTDATLLRDFREIGSREGSRIACDARTSHIPVPPPTTTSSVATGESCRPNTGWCRRRWHHHYRAQEELCKAV
jgi:hypothetical protein